ncbi:MAG: hypothetical protein AUJ51_10000 [Elusimicrobia bacterium CG1_02_56_21]|nr:MAG: hypothetical protein AUJ51_10000 [Elusimicrobia bacterium CG1_02_56_21]
MKLLTVLSVVLLMSSVHAGAQDVRSEKKPPKSESAYRALPKPKKETKQWDAAVSAGMMSDNNISHLLTNSNTNSNAKIKDNAVNFGASLSYAPAYAEKAGLELGYEYDSTDYRKHKTFSSHSHSLAAGLAPKLSRHLGLALSGNLGWVGDKKSIISKGQDAGAGLVWYGPSKLHLKGGYEYSRENVVINHAKDADSGAVYISANKRFYKRHLAFASFRLLSHKAAGPNYSYQARSAGLGLVSRWTPDFKLSLAFFHREKFYSNLDTRFLKKREDRTDTLVIRPTFKVFGGLYATGSLALSSNHSNVAIKSYSDRTYSVGVEGRF